MSENLAAALALVQSKLPEIGKSKTATVETKTGGTYSYAYADLAEVTKHILPLLGGAGLSWITKPMLLDDGKFVLEYKLLHVSGESEEGQYPLPTTGTPQQIGSAITYARRYTLCSVTGVAPEQDDDDGAAASAKDLPKTAQRRTRQPAQPTAPQTPRAPQRTAQRASAADPPLPGEDGYATNGAPDLCTDRQQTLMGVLFTNIGWTEREDRLRAASAIVGRKLGSSKELTKSEASRLIDELEPVAKADDSQAAMLELLTRYEQGAVEGEIVEDQG